MTAEHRTRPIRLLVADDQELVRAGLSLLLGMEPDLDVVVQLSDGADVADAVAEHGIDVAILDIEMPYDGLRATADIAALNRNGRDEGHDGRGRDDAHQGSGDGACRVLIVTTFGRTGYLQRAMAAGASGFMVKDAPAEALAQAVRTVNAGGRAVDPALAAEALAAGPSPLTAREMEVLSAAGDGSSVRAIASRLHLAPGTVRNHLSSAIAKTGASNRMEANRTAQARGWL
ncbi:response regulator [Corynebacterium sp. NPDC060344]|uniref:response regulator n=1 Tax=Corynebacterium sp. NPDC060344 TaxID=3347101 RepID=UPI00365BE08F